MTLELLIVAAVIGLLPALVAQRKGHDFVTWWIFGAVLFVVALPWSLLMRPNTMTRRQCPMCRSWVDRQAAVCPQCGRDIATQVA